LKVHENAFNGQFSEKCQEKSVPTYLLIFESLLLEGRCGFDEFGGQLSQAILSVAQVTFFNFKRYVTAIFTEEIQLNIRLLNFIGTTERY